MSLWRHADYTDGAAVQTMPNRPDQIRCSHGDCRGYTFRAQPAVEVVVLVNRSNYGSGGLTAKVLAPCMTHRRSMKQQMGRGISEYRGLRFTGIAPVVGLDWESAAEAVLGQERIAIAEAEAARQRAIDASREQNLTSFINGEGALLYAPSLEAADEYGRRHINVRTGYNTRLTPNQAERMANLLLEYSRTARSEAIATLAAHQAAQGRV